MRRVFDDPKEAYLKGKQARRDIVRDYSLEAMAEHIKEHIERITNILYSLDMADSLYPEDYFENYTAGDNGIDMNDAEIQERM